MRREIKIERARKLREEGWLYKDIAKRFGVSVTTVCEWCTGRVSAWKQENADRVREQNLARNEAKREWEAAQVADCPQCGQPMGVGSALPSRQRQSGKCRECLRDDARARTVRFIALREAGWLNTEIAVREGVSAAVVATCLSRAFEDFGLEVPRSPYHRSEFPEQVAA